MMAAVLTRRIAFLYMIGQLLQVPNTDINSVHSLHFDIHTLYPAYRHGFSIHFDDHQQIFQVHTYPEGSRT